MFKINPKAKPKWYQLRTRLAFFLVRLAGRIKPQNEAVTAFWLEELVTDAMVYGVGVVKPKDFYSKKITEM